MNQPRGNERTTGSKVDISLDSSVKSLAISEWVWCLTVVVVETSQIWTQSVRAITAEVLAEGKLPSRGVPSRPTP